MSSIASLLLPSSRLGCSSVKDVVRLLFSGATEIDLFFTQPFAFELVLQNYAARLPRC